MARVSGVIKSKFEVGDIVRWSYGAGEEEVIEICADGRLRTKYCNTGAISATALAEHYWTLIRKKRKPGEFLKGDVVRLKDYSLFGDYEAHEGEER